jgi:dihydrolipoamide dehydrogenase
MATHACDVAVLGAGPGGYVAAIRAAQLGKKTILVERGELGGVCLNVGCIPSKAMIHAAGTVEKTKKAAAYGVTFTGVQVDMAKLVEWKDSVVKKLTGGVAGLCQNYGVQVVKGSGALVAPTRLEVTAADGKHLVEAKDVILATGSRPIEIPGFKVDGKRVLSSTEALALQALPARTCVIGGGYIGLELGIFLAKLGSQVTVVEMTGGLLPGQDPDLVRVLERSLKKRGVALHYESRALGWKEGRDGASVQVETKKGTIDIACDVILSTVGRRPNSENLGFEKVGVKVEKGFVPVDAQCRTNVPHVYAIGDLAGQPMLAHKASKEAFIAAEAIAGKKSARDWRAVAAVIFTDPEIASVGMTEADAKAAGFDPVVGRFPFAALGRAMAIHDTEGFAKIVADRKTDVVLGVHVVGPGACDLIAEGALALEAGLRVEDLGGTIHPHPTLPEAIMEAAHALHGKSVHIFQK